MSELNKLSLPEKQGAVYDWVRDFEVETGVPANLREIQRGMGFRSPNAARDHINALERKGCVYVYRGARGDSGSLRICTLPRIQYSAEQS